MLYPIVSADFHGEGLFVRTTNVRDAGILLPQHAHCTPHLSLLTSGSVRVWKDGEVMGDFDAPAGIPIEARATHRFLTLTADVCISCIHRLSDGQNLDEVADLIHADGSLTAEELERFDAKELV